MSTQNLKPSFLSYIKELFIFSFPIMFGQVGHLLINVIIIWMAARYFSTQSVAAMSVSSSVLMPVFGIGLGLIMGLAPLISQKRGGGHKSDDHFFTCLIYTAVVGVVCAFLGWCCAFLVPFLGIDKEVVPLAQGYIRILSISFLGVYLFQGLKEFLQAHDDVIFANIIALAAVVILLGLAPCLAFGKFGFPALGPMGLIWAVLMVRIFIAVALAIYAHKYFRQRFVWIRHFIPRVIRLSIPISLTISMEVIGWAGAAILIARVSTVQAAAHNIIVSLCAVTYMIPVAIASASAVKVGFAFGQKNLHAIHRYMASALSIAVGFKMLTALCFVFLAHQIIAIYTHDIDLTWWGVRMLYIAAVFEIFDGMQATLSGCLRGLGISKPSMVLGFLAYCLIGLPVGILLMHTFKLGAVGMWVGLALAILILGVTLAIYLWIVLRRLRMKLEPVDSPELTARIYQV